MFQNCDEQIKSMLSILQFHLDWTWNRHWWSDVICLFELFDNPVLNLLIDDQNHVSMKVISWRRYLNTFALTHSTELGHFGKVQTRFNGKRNYCSVIPLRSEELYDALFYFLNYTYTV